MNLKYHMGGCCGIKTICGFWSPPSMQVSAKPEEERSSYHKDRQKDGLAVTQNDDFYWPEAPQEKCHERLRRYIDFCKEKCGSGLIEVSLSFSQWHIWEATLLTEGFEQKTEFVNGNSKMKIRVYHLTY